MLNVFKSCYLNRWFFQNLDIFQSANKMSKTELAPWRYNWDGMNGSLGGLKFRSSYGPNKTWKENLQRKHEKTMDTNILTLKTVIAYFTMLP